MVSNPGGVGPLGSVERCLELRGRHVLAVSMEPPFADPRLARIHDLLDGDRSDLGSYLDMVEEFGARSVLDIGCGTGTCACLLVDRGIDVVGVDPAEASLAVARAKPGAERVRWIHGDATTLPPVSVDLATMTGNVAQVFLHDDALTAALRGIRGAIRPGGAVAFEVREPSREAWRSWTREESERRTEVPGVGVVEGWVRFALAEAPRKPAPSAGANAGPSPRDRRPDARRDDREA